MALTGRLWAAGKVTRMRVPCRGAGLTGERRRLAAWAPGKSKDQRKPSRNQITVSCQFPFFNG
jgi:hypothetical protein